MLTRIGIAVGGIALATIATVGAAGPAAATPTAGAATAAASYYSCPAYAACLWEDKGLVTDGVRGNFYAFTRYDRSFSNNNYRNTNKTVQNSASSMVNNGVGGGGAYVTLWVDPNCQSNSFTKPPHSYDMDFSNGTPTGGPHGTFNDYLTSGAFDGSYMTTCQNP